MKFQTLGFVSDFDIRASDLHNIILYAILASTMIVIFKIIAVLYSVVLHEVSHGVAAHGMGDDTAKRSGRLTLNPLKHLDMFGSVLLPLMTFMFGGFIFGYAKPVPYNPLNLRDQRYGQAKVAIAGPLSNFALAVLFGLVLRFLPDTFHSPDFIRMLAFIVQINLGLAIFNLVPIPPLDGHWILFTFLPDRWREFKYWMMRYGVFLFLAFLFFFSSWIVPLINYLFNVIVGV